MTERIVTWSPTVAHLGQCHVAMGVFDGVHLGHQTLITDCVVGARSAGVCGGVVTFDRDPDLVVTPDSAAPQLLPLSQKLHEILNLDVDFILVIPFDAHMATLPPERFLDEVLLTASSPSLIHVGHDFRFGRYAEGDVATLRELGGPRGLSVADRELVMSDGEPITSTRIRQLVTSGDVVAARNLLGRSHRVSGTVTRGRGAGADLGFRTANLRPTEHAALPADGVYAGFVRVGEARYPAGISVGVPPTFKEASDLLEAHLIGFEGDLYGKDVIVEFVRRIRAQRAFDSMPELTQAISADIELITNILGVQS